MRPSKRLERIPPYAFAQLERKIAEKRAAGVDVISLGIGDPDRPTPPLIVEAMQEAVSEAGNAQIPEQPRARGLQGRRARLLRAPLRREARPRQRDHPRDRRQGGDLQPQPRVPGSRRLRARRRPRLPGLHGRPVAGGRRAGADGAAARARLRARPRRDRRGRRAQGEADVPRTTRTTRPARSCRTGSSSGWSSSRAPTTSSSSTTTPTRRSSSTATARPRSWPRRAPRTSASRCSRCPRATT